MSLPCALPRLTGVLIVLAALSAPLNARATPTVKFLLADGAKVSDIAKVTARAGTTDDSGIDKVEFYVDDQLKFTGTSTPYVFNWDTLAETEGPHTLSVAATDSKGATVRAKISVTVDNELGKGAEAHAQTALAALKEGDLDSATRYARRALKIDPKNLSAARAYAGVLRRQGNIDQALAVLDKADIPEDDFATRADLVALHIDKGDAGEGTEDFLKEATTAIDIYKKMQSGRAAADKADPMKSGDALFAIRDWTGAINAYQKCGPPDTAPLDCAHRLVLAYLNAGRMRDAETVTHQIIRAKRADAITQALVALTQFNNHELTKARASLQDGVDNKVLPALIVAGYVDMALKQMNKARDEANQAYAVAPDHPGVHMLRAYVLEDAIDAHKEAIRALEEDPTLAEAYVLRGFQTMLSGDAGRFAAADQLLDFALKLDPSSQYALMGKVCSYIGQRRPNEAEPLLNDLLTRDPNAPDAHVALALNYSLLDRTVHITSELNRAMKLDPDRWNDVFIPKPMDLIARVYRYRFAPVLGPGTISAQK